MTEEEPMARWHGHQLLAAELRRTVSPVRMRSTPISPATSRSNSRVLPIPQGYRAAGPVQEVEPVSGASTDAGRVAHAKAQGAKSSVPSPLCLGAFAGPPAGKEPVCLTGSVAIRVTACVLPRQSQPRVSVR